jgi:TnpA family transposase
VVVLRPPLGYGLGITFYSWTSDQLSQYGTKVVPVTVRDSTYVLDELCNNETELPIREHTTDTAGATEVIFALFDLLGYRFTPRLGTVKLTNSEAITGIQRVGRHQIFSYAAASVAVISRQMCHLWATSWR